MHRSSIRCCVHAPSSRDHPPLVSPLQIVNRRRIAHAVLFAIVAGCSNSPEATAPPRVTLAAANGSFVAEHGVSSLYELDDERVAIAAMGFHSLLIYDFATAKVDTIGRDGDGPGEFRLLNSIWPWTNGRFIVHDLSLLRATVLNADGSVDSLFKTPPSAQNDAVSLGADGSWATIGDSPSRDSFPLLRVRAVGSQTETMTWMARPRRKFVPLGSVAFNLPPEYAATDKFGRFRDGRVWIARGADNRVDIVDAHGKFTRGTPQPFARIATVKDDLHKWNGLPAIPLIDTIKNREMAPEKAPFQDVRAGADDELWFWLNQPAGYTTERYAVRAADGKIKMEVELPGAHQVLTIGKRYVYVFSKNSDDEHVVTRHPRPALSRP